MSALQPAVSNAWLTLAQENGVSDAQVANPIYPGPITGDHAGSDVDTVPGRDPVGGQNAGQLPVGETDVSGGGGYYPEQNYSGHAAPVAPFDSGAKPFTSSGAIADTHSFDTGGVERGRSVIQPTAKGWFRRILSGQTYDSQAYTYTPEGFKVNVPAGRTDLDQYQGQNADAYDPFLIGYSERPIHANLAYEPQALAGTQNAYTPSGELPQMIATGGQGNSVYESPDDPPVTSSADGVSTGQSPATGDPEGGYF
jgi:hypothetical protein